MKRTLFVLFLLLLVNSSDAANKHRERTRTDFDTKRLFRTDVPVPSVQNVRPFRSAPNVTPADGIIIGVSDFDEGITAGFGRRIVRYDGTNQMHMTFLERDLSLPSPGNRAVAKYIRWSADGSMVTGYPHPRTLGATGHAGIDVITGGGGEGIAIMTYVAGGKTYLAIDDGPGLGHFTETELPAVISHRPVSDPQVTYDRSRNDILFTANIGQNDLLVARSSDFGSSWVGIDSLRRHLPHSGFDIVGASPLLVGADGAYYRPAALTGAGSLPPLGTAHPDSADRIGYFTSTDKGANWTWTTLGVDGEPLGVAPNDTVHVLFENFAQYAAAVDEKVYPGAKRSLHLVVNGYCLKVLDSSRVSNRFYTLYRGPQSWQWTIISDRTRGASSEYDSRYYRYSGNGIGNAYPAISIKGRTKAAFWSEPVFVNGRLDTAGGRIRYALQAADMMNQYGTDVQRYSTRYMDALFPFAAPPDSTFTPTVPFLYLLDTARGSSAAGEGAPRPAMWVFRTVAVPKREAENGGLTVSVFIYSWADSGGSIEPNGFVTSTNLVTKTYTITPAEGYKTDSVVVNRTNIGPVSSYAFIQPECDQTIRAYFSPAVSGIDAEGSLPRAMSLRNNRPNPFNPSTVIPYDVSAAADVSIDVYDILGRRVASLVNERRGPGRYEARFDGSRLSSGVYYCTMRAGAYSAVKKLMLVK